MGYSGAELEEAIREGLFEAFAAGVELRTEHLLAALKSTFPLSRTMGQQIEDLRKWARVRARLAGTDEPDPLPAEAATGIPKLRQETRNPFIPGGKG